MSWTARDALGRLPRGLLGMALLVALIEGYVSANFRRFSRLEAEDWQAANRSSNGNLPSGGVLMLGDSQVKFGLSPLLLEGKLGQPSQCLAIQGGQAPATYFLLEHALRSGTLPAAIVVGFEPHLLRDGPEHNRRMWPELLTPGEALDLAWTAGDDWNSYDTSNKHEIGVFAAIAAGLALPSYRERQEIRENVMMAFRGQVPHMPGWLDMAARNRGMNRGALAMAVGSGDPTHDPKNWAEPTQNPWAPHRVNDHYVRKFLKLAAQYKIPVYWALMPVTPGLQDKFERNGMDSKYFPYIRKLQERFSNLYVLDWRHSGYQPPLFTDAQHLNIAGATATTEALADYFRAAFRGEGIDRRWVEMPAYREATERLAIEDSEHSSAFMKSTASLRR